MMKIPIPTLHLFPVLDEKLISLLRSLSPEDWNRPTRAKLWTVKDIAAHLLDGNIRTLSMSRDGYHGVKPTGIDSYDNLVQYLNQLNADWVKAMKRVSPSVLIEMLESTGKQYCSYLETIDPFADAIFSVAWAGEEKSANWFHIAREYTEKWHHQQQIREAAGKPGIITHELYYPVLDTFMRALPHTYRPVDAVSGIYVQVTVNGDGGGSWNLMRTDTAWSLTPSMNNPPRTAISMDGETAWKLMTKGLLKGEAERLIKIEGDRKLGEPIFSMVSVMA
jgi:uncharacterized protein (TIGR03083 family)